MSRLLMGGLLLVGSLALGLGRRAAAWRAPTRRPCGPARCRRSESVRSAPSLGVTVIRRSSAAGERAVDAALALDAGRGLDRDLVPRPARSGPACAAVRSRPGLVTSSVYRPAMGSCSSSARETPGQPRHRSDVDAALGGRRATFSMPPLCSTSKRLEASGVRRGRRPRRSRTRVGSVRRHALAPPFTRPKERRGPEPTPFDRTIAHGPGHVYQRTG